MGKITDTKTSDIYKQYRLNFETVYNPARPVFLQMIQQQSGLLYQKSGYNQGAGNKGLQQSISRLIVGNNINKCCTKFFFGIFYFLQYLTNNTIPACKTGGSSNIGQL